MGVGETREAWGFPPSHSAFPLSCYIPSPLLLCSTLASPILPLSPSPTFPSHYFFPPLSLFQFLPCTLSSTPPFDRREQGRVVAANETRRFE